MTFRVILKKALIIALAAVMIILPQSGLFVSAADDATQGKGRPLTVYYMSGQDDYGYDHYYNTGIIRDGGTGTLSVDLMDRDPFIWLGYYGQQTVELSDTEVAEIISTVQKPDDFPTYYLSLKQAGTATFNITLPGDGEYRTCTYTFKLVVYDNSNSGSQGGSGETGGQNGESGGSGDQNGESGGQNGESGGSGDQNGNGNGSGDQTGSGDNGTSGSGNSGASFDSGNPAGQSAGQASGSGNTAGQATPKVAKNRTANANIVVSFAAKSKPKLKCSKRMRRKNKIVWNKVAGANGYELFIRYPGSKKYVKALTKSASVKSVTHKGLSKGRIYRYKIRAFSIVDGVKKYGVFSKVLKVKVK